MALFFELDDFYFSTMSSFELDENLWSRVHWSDVSIVKNLLTREIIQLTSDGINITIN